MMEALLKNCKPSTKLCIAVDLTGKNEWIKTKTMADWQKKKPDLHKRPAIFCFMRFVTVESLMTPVNNILTVTPPGQRRPVFIYNASCNTLILKVFQYGSNAVIF